MRISRRPRICLNQQEALTPKQIGRHAKNGGTGEVRGDVAAFAIIDVGTSSFHPTFFLAVACEVVVAFCPT